MDVKRVTHCTSQYSNNGHCTN